MTFRMRLVLLPIVLLLLVCATSTSHAGERRRVAVVQFKGGDAILRGAVMTSLSDGHTILLPNEVDKAVSEVGLTNKCKAGKVAALGAAIKAEVVICGGTKGVPWRRRFTLTVLNGADGKKLGTAAVILLKVGLTEAQMKRITPRLEKAIAKATPMEAPDEPGSSTAAPAPLKPVPTLVKDLDSPVLGDRLDAVRELARHRNWQAAPPMSCALLRDSEVDVREAAAKALTHAWHDQVVNHALRLAGRMETNSALRAKIKAGAAGLKQEVTGLLAQLSSADQNQRLAAVQALSMAGYKETVMGLIRAAGDVDPGVRLFALQGLRAFNSAQARSKIQAATRDGDANVARAARGFLDERKRLAAWRGFHMSYMKVVKKTSSRYPAWRADAAVALGISGADSAINRLEQMLRGDPEASVRLAAAWSLMVLGTPRSMAAVRGSSRSDSDPRVRRTCAGFLQLKSLNFKQEILKLSDKLGEFRLQAAQTLALRSDEPSTLYPLARSALCDPSAHVRMAALTGLAREGSPLANEAIRLAMFRDGADDVRRFAMMLHVLVAWEEPEPAKTVASKETASWMSDSEDPIATEKRREEAAKKVAAEKKKEEEAVPDRCPVGDCHAIRVMVGATSLFMRRLEVDVGDVGRPVDGEPMTSTPVAGMGIGFELYPGAFFTRGWFSNIGVGLRYARSFGLSWKTDKMTDKDEATTITHQVISADFLRLRWQPVRNERVPTINFRFGLHHQEFLFNDDNDLSASPVPDLTATSLVVGLSLDVPIVTAKLFFGADYLAVQSWGEIMEPTNFRTKLSTDLLGPLRGYDVGSGFAIQARAGVRGPLAWKIGWHLEAAYNYYNISFDSTSARKAEGSQDHFLSGVLYLTFAH